MAGRLLDRGSAAYQAEATEVADDSPTLAGPKITTAMGRSFVPFSIELGEDWASLSAELLRLMSDARDVLDATKFLKGSGTDQPAGVLTGLGAPQKIETASSTAFVVNNAWSLKARSATVEARQAYSRPTRTRGTEYNDRRHGR